MKLCSVLSSVTACLIAGVAADFQIYYEQQLIVSPTGDENTISNIRVFDGPPSCDDVNLNYASLSIVGDASSAGYARCDGCGDYADVATWDISELEMNAANDWGHYTIYENAGYQLTPADGGPLQGSCTRDNGNTYDCTTGLDNTHGTRLFVCSSPKGGIHAK
ncbi:hypothetical protein ALT_9015 [Aspergillus lentulus]|uniref:Uncharacterized protein n=1 Tax=Aspergillus lentulus TaxID=293939 RepID=A0AAN4PSU7_ASPLE|nr:uncharacterized protein IFM58399_09495 [Aspergillus lentulus]KAF4152096.1 hypothetical protein CNMCM6069_002581 [Aspergillus lentulus]KAF4162337.1 hypothetical protein CNMCM6936_002275 [Aspergillus lentulus]KAF4171099.1 hypothetical protein CNMCM8060_003695 [Aspergillus lentulus]KAF4179079.1 hypothetical protein CNMCM7927_002134 [Aspergillus lentulus]KAF4188048.1 hypothetical protein CNMCM8694_005160 [Aspergillus lentulus]